MKTPEEVLMGMLNPNRSGRLDVVEIDIAIEAIKAYAAQFVVNEHKYPPLPREMDRVVMFPMELEDDDEGNKSDEEE